MLLCSFFQPAFAEEESADGHDEEAARYYERKMWDAARREWMAAYNMDARPRYLFNIGQTYRKENLHREAVDHFLRYFSEIERPEYKGKDRLDPTVKIDLEAYVAQMRAELERIGQPKDRSANNTEPAPYLVSDEIVEAEELFDQMVKEYRAGNTAVAKDLEKRLDEVYRQRQDPVLLLYFAQAYEKIGKKREALDSYRRYIATEPADLQQRRLANERFSALTPPPPGQKYLWPALIFGALGLAGVGAGVGTFIEANNNFTAFQEAQTETEKLDRRKRGEDLNLYSIISYAGGGALLATSAIFLGVAIKKGVRQKQNLMPTIQRGDSQARLDLLRPLSTPSSNRFNITSLGLMPLVGGGTIILRGSF